MLFECGVVLARLRKHIEAMKAAPRIVSAVGAAIAPCSPPAQRRPERPRASNAMARRGAV